MPAIARAGEVARIRAANPRIEHYRQKYLTKADQGTLFTRSPAKQEVERKLARKAAKINRRLKRSKSSQPVLVILEGPDGAGKSSTIRRILPAFEGARPTQVVHFGAPPPGSNKIHWTKRFFDQLPKDGEVRIWDRSHNGRVVYEPYHGLISAREAKRSIKDIRAFERLIASKVKLVKIFLDVDGNRQARTIGKREVKAPEKLSESDYLTYRDRKRIRAGFDRVLGGTRGWHVVDMNDRDAGRAEILKILKRELK